jgi:hypothetical protein
VFLRLESINLTLIKEEEQGRGRVGLLKEKQYNACNLEGIQGPKMQMNTLSW